MNAPASDKNSNVSIKQKTIWPSLIFGRKHHSQPAFLVHLNSRYTYGVRISQHIAKRIFKKPAFILTIPNEKWHIMIQISQQLLYRYLINLIHLCIVLPFTEI